MPEDIPMPKVFHDIDLRRQKIIDKSIISMIQRCNLGVELYIENIFRYIILKDDGIINIRYEKKNRSVKFNRNKYPVFNKKNCCILVIKSELNNEINIKLMNNGTIYIYMVLDQ
jgi:hypothetical protein